MSTRGAAAAGGPQSRGRRVPGRTSPLGPRLDIHLDFDIDHA
jgi:hypothetical protein